MRLCSVTKQLMTCGWVAGDGDKYFKHERDAIDWCHLNGYSTLDEAYEDEAIYWTDWGDQFFQWAFEFDELSDKKYNLSNEQVIELIESRHTPKSAIQMLIDNPKYLIK